MKRALARCIVAAAVVAGTALFVAAPANADTGTAGLHTVYHDVYSLNDFTMTCGGHTLAVVGGTQDMHAETSVNDAGRWHVAQTTIWKNVSLVDDQGISYTLSGTSHSDFTSSLDQPTWAHASDTYTVRYANGGGVAGRVRVTTRYTYDPATGEPTSTTVDDGTCTTFDWP